MSRYHTRTHLAPAPFVSPFPFHLDETDLYVRYGRRVFPGTFTSTGGDGCPGALIPYSDHIITQVATGLFGVREATI